MNKNVLIVSSVGGFLPQFEMERVTQLQQMGMQVHYAANFDRPEYYMNPQELQHRQICLHNICVPESPYVITANLQAIWQLKRIIDTCEIDLIHCHNSMGGATARLAAILSSRKPKVIYTSHGFYFYTGAPVTNWLFYPVEYLLAPATDCIITINREDYLRSEKFHLKKNGFCRQIPGVGLDSERFSPRPELRNEVRNALNLEENCFHIMCVANLHKSKNLKSIICAVQTMKDCNIRLTICGDGPERPSLSRYIKELKLDSTVRLYGFRTDVEYLLQSADCFVFPSVREGLGMAALEAMACGLPIIAADNRGTREYMKDGINGIVVNARDIAGYSSALKLLAQNPQLRQSMGQEARITAEYFSSEQPSAIMHTVYQRLLQ